MPDAPLEQRILSFLGQPGCRPQKPRMIARQLGVPRDELDEFKRLIKRMVKRGALAYGANHLLGLPMTVEATHAAQQTRRAKQKPAPRASSPPPAAPASAAESRAKPAPAQPAGNKSAARKSTADGGSHAARVGHVVGVFRRMEAGFGFVRPAGTSAAQGKSQDIYIPADKARDAASGDTVAVRLSKGRGGMRQRIAGEIVEVLERETHQFVGLYFERAGSAYVQIDGMVFAQPIAVGDPGAKNARADDKVVIEMIRFPSHVHDGEGVIVEVLGPRGQPGVDTLSIIREFGLPGEFPDDVQESARHETEKFDEAIAAGRLDLTHETIVTIDPVDARDFDDAISLTRIENGHWRLGVHIADVSHFVRVGSPLDREAYQRATSVYLPDRVIPMLPELISNGLASLQPHRVRYAKTAFIEYTPDGAFVAADFHNTAIRSKHRFTYEEIDDYLARPEPWRKKLGAPVFDLVGRMHELAMILRGRRLRRGALELSLPEVKVDLDKNGRVAGAHRVESTVSHQIIEEFMLAANEAVAEWLAGHELLFLRRIHEAPDPRKMQALTEFVQELGFSVERLEDRFELQRLLIQVHDRPERHAVNYAVLRSLARAVYGPAVEGHYALASDCYCHFTSPIRRYPDLTIHRLMNSLLTRHKPKNDLDELNRVGLHCSDRERVAEAAERELTKVKLLDYLASRVGEELDAIVTGVEEFGLFVQGIELPAEGLVHISSLRDDYYSYDRRAHTLSGRRSGNQFRLGDPIRVAVARVDVDRRVLDFRLVERRSRTPQAPRPSKERGGKAAPRKGKRGPAKERKQARGKRRR